MEPALKQFWLGARSQQESKVTSLPLPHVKASHLGRPACHLSGMVATKIHTIFSSPSGNKTHYFWAMESNF